MDINTFKQIEKEYGCGYFKVCIDRICPCGPNSKTSKGFDGRTYRGMEIKYKNEISRQNELYNSYNFEEVS